MKTTTVRTTVRTAVAAALILFGAAACGSDEESGDAAAESVPAAEAGDAAADTADEAPATTAPAATEAPAEGGSLAVALADNMMEDAETEGGPVDSREEAECWANGIVDGIGEDRLNEMGVTPSSIGELDELPLTEDEVGIVVDSLFGCTDVRAAFAEEFTADFGEEAAQCFADELEPELLKQILGAQIAGGEASAEAFSAFQEIATACGIGA